MDMTVPTSWIELTRDQFWKLLENVNWKRDNFANGDYYYAVGGHIVTRRVAIHTLNGHYYIDPTYFKTTT